MSEEFPPDWAIERAYSLTIAEPGANHGGYSLSIVKRDYLGFPTTIALARYIAEHEEAPIDPLLIEAVEIAGFAFDDFSSDDFKSGRVEKDPKVDMCLEALRRGIELGKAEQ